jgi:stress response protein SCP2
MALTLVKGQNALLAATRLAATVSAARPVDLSALLLNAEGKVRSDADFVFYNQPQGPGVSCRPSVIDVDLAAVPADVERVLVVVSLDEPAVTFGDVAVPMARLADAAGAEVGLFPITGLGRERAVIAWELYRRAGTWKMRAVGQGYAGGLGELVAAYGVDVEDPVPAVSAPAPATPAAQPAWVATSPPPGQPVAGSSEERLYQQVSSIFEDATRSTAAFRSATGYAAQRREDELGGLLADPRTRNSPQTDAARTEVERRHDELVARATADHQRDVAHLVGELTELDTVLPAAMATWNSPVWRDWSPPAVEATAIRVGDLHLPEAPELRVPLLFRLPLIKPLWVDWSGGHRNAALVMARGLVARLLAAYPRGELKVHVADLVGGGAAARALDPLGGSGAGVVAAPPATTPQQLGELLASLFDRFDLVQMALRSDTVDALQGVIDGGRRLLVLHDFPYGFDDRSTGQIRYLLDQGPAAGVHLLFVADLTEAATLGPLISSLWQSALLLPAVPDDHIGDPWVGLAWTFTPDVPAEGATAVDAVLTRLAGPAAPG